MSDMAGGKWEWPGGHLEEGELPFAGAQREWEEEVGFPLPEGRVVATRVSANGYQLFVYQVASETDVPLGSDRQVVNPDGDTFEACAWFDPTDLIGMPSLRPEIARDFPDSELATPVVKSVEPPRMMGASIDETEVLDYLQEHYPDADLGWVRRCLWTADNVLLADVKWEARPGGIDGDKVAGMTAKLDDGWQPHPVVLVAPSAGAQLVVADGYHRCAALAEAGQHAVAAWVASPKPGNTGWEADVLAMQFSVTNHPSYKTVVRPLPASLVGQAEPLDWLVDDDTGEAWQIKAIADDRVVLQPLS